MSEPIESKRERAATARAPATAGQLDPRLIAGVVGALFGAVATWAYVSSSYRLVAPDKYDQLLRGAPAVTADRSSVSRPNQATGTDTARPTPTAEAPPPSPPPSRGGPQAPPSGDFMGGVEQFNLEGSAAKGPANAKLTIIEFSDFECPACSHWFPAVEGMVKQRADKIRLVFKHLPLPDHKQARLAAEAAEAAGKQGKFWELAGLMFQNHSSLSRDKIMQLAAQLNLDVKKLEADMQSSEVTQRVSRDLAEAERTIATSARPAAPAFFINGRRADVGSPDQLTALIDKTLQ
jgi:protein-disulfide isomerase